MFGDVECNIGAQELLIMAIRYTAGTLKTFITECLMVILQNNYFITYDRRHQPRARFYSSIHCGSTDTKGQRLKVNLRDVGSEFMIHKALDS